jgi:hypothetical protein
MRNYVLFISLIFTVSFGWSQGLHTQGTQIVNSNGTALEAGKLWRVI